MLYGLYDFVEDSLNAEILKKVLFSYSEKLIKNCKKNVSDSVIDLNENQGIRILIRSLRQVYAIYNETVPDDLARLFLECSNVRNKIKTMNPVEEKLFKAVEKRFKEHSFIDSIKWGNHWEGFEADIMISTKLGRINLEVDGKHHRKEKNIIHDKRRDFVLEREGIIVLRFDLKGNETQDEFMKRVKDVIEEKKKILWKQEQEDRRKKKK